MSVDAHELDDIFQRAEDSKDLHLKPQLWDRLESRLEIDLHKRQLNYFRYISYISMAACITLLVGVFIHFMPQNTDSKLFTMESLESQVENHSIYNVEYISILNENLFSCEQC